MDIVGGRVSFEGSGYGGQQDEDFFYYVCNVFVLSLREGFCIVYQQIMKWLKNKV